MNEMKSEKNAAKNEAKWIEKRKSKKKGPYTRSDRTQEDDKNTSKRCDMKHVEEVKRFTTAVSGLAIILDTNYYYYCYY